MYKVMYFDKLGAKSYINFIDNFKTKEEAQKYADEIKSYVISTIIAKKKRDFTYEILNINF